MTDSSRATSTCHALLIGIDKYLENKLPDDSYYRDLSGCVRDINHVEKFLLTTLKVPQTNIIKLTATDNGKEKPAEPRELWPTYENILAGFQTLISKSNPGDQVYIHYSGHGGRANSLVPELKSNGLDESLVPTNIGHSEARYLRDIEMAKLLRSMIDRKLLVTMVLDSCHSAGMTRGPDTKIRGLGSVDTTERPTDSLVGSIHELVEAWRQTGGETARSVSAAPWLPASEGAIVLSACGSTESAYEYAFDGVESNGALTYWFLNSLGELGLNLTYNQLHDRIVSKVHSQFATQTPHLEGDGNRVVFGVDRVPASYAAVVMEVDADKSRVLLNVGQAQGVRRGSEFAIESLTRGDRDDSQRRLGIATIKTLEATESWANFTPATGSTAAVQQGDHAYLINPGSIQLVKNVRLLDEADKSMPLEERQRILDAIGKAIEESAWLKLIDDKKTASYQVALNESKELEILDASGKNLTTSNIPLSNAASAIVVSRLEHLAKYHVIQEIDNHDTRSPLARKLSVKWVGFQSDFEYGEKPSPIPFRSKSKVPTVKDGEWVFFKIKNLSDSLLKVAVLDLQPDWGISQVHPVPPFSFVELEPGCEELVPLNAGLPENCPLGRDILKVFASLDSGNFQWLELPSLDAGFRSTKNKTRQPFGLDLLFDALTDEKPAMRNLSPAAYPSRGWTTTQIELDITK